jgi:hypothetical protein
MYHLFFVSKVAHSIIGRDQLMVKNMTFSLLADTEAEEVHRVSPRNKCSLSITADQ